MNDEKPEIMTVADVADYLRIKTSTVYYGITGRGKGVNELSEGLYNRHL